jgi:hypothetical protein
LRPRGGTLPPLPPAEARVLFALERTGETGFTPEAVVAAGMVRVPLARVPAAALVRSVGICVVACDAGAAARAPCAPALVWEVAPTVREVVLAAAREAEPAACELASAPVFFLPKEKREPEVCCEALRVVCAAPELLAPKREPAAGRTLPEALELEAKREPEAVRFVGFTEPEAECELVLG